MTTDEQHALSHKYIGETITLIPLPSGNIALFQVRGHNRELLSIGPDVSTVLASILARYPDRLAANQKATSRVAEHNHSTRDLSTLASELKL